MASPAKDPYWLNRDRERSAVDIFRYVSAFDAVAIRLARQGVACAVVAAALLLTYGAYVAFGLWGGVRENGTIAAPSLRAPVTIARDTRDVPHIVASNEHDLLYAQGFAEATDRLFQMELTRRYALGTLAEVLGSRALAIDGEQRAYGARDIAAAQWRRLDARDREDLQAFADGVNAAMVRQPLPVEFRLLLYRPRPWTVQDSLAVALAVSIALGDSYHDVLERNDVWQHYGSATFAQRYPLSDPRYDVSLGGRFGVPALRQARRDTVAQAHLPSRSARPRIGSNAWAVGAMRSAGGRALLANDPHLELTIPGLWYVVDLRAPGMHVAGAAIPGAPGVALGHNERVAWGATNADVASTSVYRAGALARSGWHTERFAVRFGSAVSRAYYRNGEFFGTNDSYDGNKLVLVRCAHLYGTSPIATFLALDRARSAGEATRVLARYTGPAENFVLADTSGAVAYHLAGTVVDDPAWGRYVHPARERAVPLARIPYAQLPSLAPRRNGTIVTANNKMYGAGYTYRLAPYFDPPYRAYRIAQLLHARDTYDTAYFTKMQLDEISPIDREFARRLSEFAAHNGERRDLVGALHAWNGSFSSSSRLATVVHSVRTGAEQSAPSLYAALESLRSGDAVSNFGADLTGELYYAGSVKESWGRAGAVSVEHPLAPLHFGFLNGATFPGAGDEYTIRLQEPGFAQSFRAVWDVGNWDAGGIAIPSGESGRPGSAHYLDLSGAWIAGRMDSLPFSAPAVQAATRTRLTLEPR